MEAAWDCVRCAQNRDILEHQIKKGTLPRMLTYAKKYRALLVVFLIAVVLDAVVSSVTPLLFRGIIDNAIPEKSKGLVIFLASLGAGLAIFDAVLSLFERRTSAVIGEGSDLRPARQGLHPHPRDADRLLLAHADRRVDQSIEQ